MSTSMFFISESVLRTYKQNASRRVGGVSSAHLTEAIAASLGFRSHAALRAKLDGHPTIEVPKPSNKLFNSRLRDFGYSVPDDLRLVPELDRSYTPFRNYPLHRRRGLRWIAWRNLVVAAVNAGLEQRLFGLSPQEDWWPGAELTGNASRSHIYRFVFDGLPAIASVEASRGSELLINVVLNPRDAGVEPDGCQGLADGAAVGLCWLERKLGAWIQDGGEDFSCKRSVLSRVAGVVVEPNGYSDQGSFIM